MLNYQSPKSPGKNSAGFATWFSTRLEKKNLGFLSMTPLKGDYQFYRDARTFSWLYRMEAWNDVMKVTRLETLFIIVDKKFKKVGVRLILLV